MLIMQLLDVKQKKDNICGFFEIRGKSAISVLVLFFKENVVRTIESYLGIVLITSLPFPLTS